MESEWHLVVGRHDIGSDTILRFGGRAASRGRGMAEAPHPAKIAMTVPHFLAVPNIVANTDFLCIVPRRLAQVYADFGQVRIAALPGAGEAFEVSQFWHKRLDADPASKWLRQTVRSLFAHSGGAAKRNGRDRLRLSQP